MKYDNFIILISCRFHELINFIILISCRIHAEFKNNELNYCQDDIFKIQEIYSNSFDKNITFCPIIFFATYIEDILNLDNIDIKFDKYSKVPRDIKIDDLILMSCSYMNNLHITQLFIRYNALFTNKVFNSKAYYSQNYELIHNKYDKLNLNIEKLSALFFVEYGYWNNLKLKYINPILSYFPLGEYSLI